jgi:hypothetical protein
LNIRANTFCFSGPYNPSGNPIGREHSRDSWGCFHETPTSWTLVRVGVTTKSRIAKRHGERMWRILPNGKKWSQGDRLQRQLF